LITQRQYTPIPVIIGEITADAQFAPASSLLWSKKPSGLPILFRPRGARRLSEERTGKITSFLTDLSWPTPLRRAAVGAAAELGSRSFTTATLVSRPEPWNLVRSRRCAGGKRIRKPLFTAAVQFYYAGVAQGRDGQDTAAVCAVLEKLAGIERKGSE
jgi:hypothetical protein